MQLLSLFFVTATVAFNLSVSEQSTSQTLQNILKLTFNTSLLHSPLLTTNTLHTSRLHTQLAPDCIGDDVASIVNGMADGDVTLLENTRFYPEETKNEPGFVKKLAAPFDMFVNDAFGTAHRAHASTEGVAKVLSPAVSGFLLAKELKYLDGAVTNGERPLAAIVGGSKVSSKITVLESLLDKADKVVIGGGMVFTFLKAQGLGVGSSLVEDDFVETAKAVLAKAEKLGKKIILPSDVIVADKVSERSELALRKTRVNPLNSFGSLVSLVSLVLH